MSLNSRLAKLEEAARPDGGVIVMWRHVDETDAQAVERWRQEHPGQDPDAPGLKVIILRWSKEGEESAWDAGAPTPEEGSPDAV